MAAAPFLSPSIKEKGHALDTALDDWGADSGDHSDLVLYALRFWGPLCGPFATTLRYKRRVQGRARMSGLRSINPVWCSDEHQRPRDIFFGI